MPSLPVRPPARWPVKRPVAKDELAAALTTSLDDREDNDLARCMVLVALVGWRWWASDLSLAELATLPEVLVTARELQLVVERFKALPVPVAVSASFEATIDEVFLLWATAAAAASRRASATRETAGRALWPPTGSVEDPELTAEDAVDAPKVEWRRDPICVGW